MDLEKLLREVVDELKELGAEERAGPRGAQLASEAEALAAHIKGTRRPSRFAGEGASDEVLEAIRKGGGVERGGGGRVVEPMYAQRGGRLGIGQLMQKALAEGTGSAGGFLVPVEISTEIIGLLRARSAIMRLGPRVVPVKKELAVTSLSTGASATYVAENAPATVSEQTFAQASLLRPKELVALVPISNRLLRDAADSPDAEEVIQRDLAEVLALRSDLAFIDGPGGLQPLGVRNHSGLTPAPNLGANGAAPTFDNLKDVVASLRAVNAPFEKPGWVFNARLLSTLEKIKTTTGEYLADAGLLTFDRTGGGGTLLGFPFVTTSQIPVNITAGSSSDTTFLIFGSDWSEAWIGENEALEIEVSAEATYTTDGGTTWHSAFQNRQHVFRATATHDFALRRPQLFSVLSGVRP